MTHTVLIVEDASGTRSDLTRMVGRRHRVLACASAAEAIDLVHRQGPVSLVLVDHGLPGSSGLDLLQEVGREAPHAMRLLLTCQADFHLALKAVNEGSVFRLLTRPCGEDEILSAVEGALEAYRLDEDERELSGRLRFARESLEGFTDVLEGRIAVQTAAMRRLHDLALTLNNADSLQEIADASAETAWELLQVSSVLVRISDPKHADRGVEARHGDPSRWQAGVSSRQGVHREELRSSEGDLGEIILETSADVDASGGALLPRDRGKLNLLVSSTVVAVRNELRRHERDAAQQAAIMALAGLSERRDHETGLHLERVAGYCRVLAVGLVDLGHHEDYITSEFIDHLVRSSPLHDIGKVAIPDSILLNPGKLTLEEEAVMRTHTTIGAETLEGVMEDADAHSFLAMGRDIALCHHEKWDGSGYPRGIAGEAIPLSARIIALADVYDALTTERRYKAAWEHDRVVPWITALSGRHFDPQVVASFLRCQEEFNVIRADLSECAGPGLGMRQDSPGSVDSTLDAG